MNVEEMKLKIAQLSSRSEILGDKIEELHQEKYQYEKEIMDLNEQLERLKYFGMRQYQYYEKIRNLTFYEGKYKIVIGAMGNDSISVEIVEEDDLKVVVYGSSNINTGVMNIYRDANYQKGTKPYYRKYYSQDIPKSRKEQFEEMLAIKAKYGKMMVDAEFEPKKEGVEER